MKIKNIHYPTPLEKIDDIFNNNIDIFVETENGWHLTLTVCTPQFYSSYMEKLNLDFVPAGIPDIIVKSLTHENIKNALESYCESNAYYLKLYYLMGVIHDKELNELTEKFSEESVTE